MGRRRGIYGSCGGRQGELEWPNKRNGLGSMGRVVFT